MIVEFLDANRHEVFEGRELGVEPICRVLRQAGLQVAPSVYYAAKSRAPSARSRRDAVMGPVIRALWEDNYRVYGAHKVWKAARRAGHDIGRDQVARLMRAEQIKGCGAPGRCGPLDPTRGCRGIPIWST